MAKRSSTAITTRIKKQMFVEALEKNLGVLTPTFKSVGINHQTYYNWLAKDEKFKSQIDNIKEAAIDFVESNLYKAVKDGNVTAMIFYLKTRAKHRGYIERTEQDIRVQPLNFKFGDEIDDNNLLEE